MKMKTRTMPPVSPGELLEHEFLIPFAISKYRLAKDIGVPAGRIGEIIMGKRSISVDTALRLSKYFGLSEGYWIKAQYLYDLEQTKSEIESELEKIVPIARHSKRG